MPYYPVGVSSLTQLSEHIGPGVILWNEDVDGETSFAVTNTNVDDNPFAALKAGYGGVGADNAWFIKYQDTYADPAGGRSGLNLPDDSDWAGSLEIFSGAVGDLFITSGNAIRFGGIGLIGQADMVVIDSTGLTVDSAFPINGDGSALSGITKSQVGLGSVSDDLQTKDSIVPNTAPLSGQILVGTGFAYSKQTISGSGATITLGSTGTITIGAIANASLSNSAITIAGTSTALGTSITLDTISGVSANGFLKRTAANTWTNLAAIAGWTAPSGSALRTGYATSTATLNQVSQTLKALIDDLTTQGLIGA